MAGRVHPIQAGAGHGHGAGFGVQRTAMRGRVDAGGQAAAYGQTAAAQVGGEILRQGDACTGGVATTDNRQLGLLQIVRVAMDEKHQRRIGDGGQAWRVGGLLDGNQVVVAALQPGQIGFHRLPVRLV